MDRIFITDLKIETRIGVYDWERQVAQPLLLNLDIGLAHNRAAESDDLADAIDYAAVVQRIEALLADHSYRLLERLAEAIANLVLNEFAAASVKVSIAKLAPLPRVRQLGVCIERPPKI